MDRESALRSGNTAFNLLDAQSEDRKTDIASIVW
jgi:hypothetical protein